MDSKAFRVARSPVGARSATSIDIATSPVPPRKKSYAAVRACFDPKRLVLAALLVSSPAAARDSLGVFDRWGAFSDDSPRRCFAIAEPVGGARDRRWRPFASIASWPASGARNQLNVRLSRQRDPRAKVTLSIGERRFALSAGRVDAWAPDRRADAAIVAALRSGRSMSVETVAANGAPFADVYALRGAATAIDAASLACAR